MTQESGSRSLCSGAGLPLRPREREVALFGFRPPPVVSTRQPLQHDATINNNNNATTTSFNLVLFSFLSNSIPRTRRVLILLHWPQLLVQPVPFHNLLRTFTSTNSLPSNFFRQLCRTGTSGIHCKGTSETIPRDVGWDRVAWSEAFAVRVGSLLVGSSSAGWKEW